MKTIVCLMNIRLITLMKDKAIQFQGIRQRILFSKAKRAGASSITEAPVFYLRKRAAFVSYRLPLLYPVSCRLSKVSAAGSRSLLFSFRFCIWVARRQNQKV